MKTIRSATPSLLLILGLGLGGCPGKDDPNDCVDTPGIVPGVGVRTAAGQWCLDAPQRAIESSVGAAAASSDLAPVGQHAAHPEHHLAALYSPDAETPRLAAVYLDEGVAVTTPGGVGLGSDGAAVRAEFGEPVIDPFLGVWWYRAQGIAFTLNGDRVTRVQVFRPPLLAESSGLGR